MRPVPPTGNSSSAIPIVPGPCGTARGGFAGRLAASAPELAFGACEASGTTLYGTIKIDAERPASIVNVVSGSGLLPVPVIHNTAYGASKAALWMMTRYLAVNLAPLIRVNALCPGNVSATGQPHTETARKMLSQIPMGRVGKPGEMAGAAVYLASDASSFTTGAMLVCNGGRDW